MPVISLDRSTTWSLFQHSLNCSEGKKMMGHCLSSADHYGIAASIGDKESSISKTFRQVTFLSLENFERAQSIRSLL